MGEVVGDRTTFFDLLQQRLFALPVQIGVDLDLDAQLLEARADVRVAAEQAGGVVVRFDLEAHAA